MTYADASTSVIMTNAGISTLFRRAVEAPSRAALLCALACVAASLACVASVQAQGVPTSAAPALSPPTTAAQVVGVIFDSLRSQPLSGATVQLIESPPGHHSYSGTTDSLGRFRVDSVRPGAYVAGFLHPLLDTLGISAPYGALAVSEGAQVHLELAVPSGAQIARAICGGAAAPKAKADSVGILVGHVHDAGSGAPEPSSTVTIEWQTLVFGHGGPHTESQQLRATTNKDGWFAVCDLAAADYRVHAERGARATGLIDLTVRPHDVARISLAIGGDPSVAGADSAARRGATLAGRVTAHDGRPLEGAQVVIEGPYASATTDSHGAFLLTGLPEGTRMAEIRVLGYEPLRVSVELSRAERREITIAMDKRVATLEAVTVFGTQKKELRDLTGFAERKGKGFGRFVSKEEIEQANVFSACELLRRVPGVNIASDGTAQGCYAQIRGAVSGATGIGKKPAPHSCEPTVYEDNIPFGGTLSQFASTVPPHDIVGIEVYTTATQPPQFPGACGAIVIWTRKGVGD